MVGHIPEPIVIGQLFVNFQTLNKLIENWAIKNMFAFKTSNKNTSHIVYISVENRYTWQVRASCSKVDEIQISILTAEHTRIAQHLTQHYSASSSMQWLHLQVYVSNHDNVTLYTTLRAIIDFMSFKSASYSTSLVSGFSEMQTWFFLTAFF